jgi:hypothetical protein
VIILQFSYLPGTPVALYMSESESFVRCIGDKFFPDPAKCRNLHFEHSRPLYTFLLWVVKLGTNGQSDALLQLNHGAFHLESST